MYFGTSHSMNQSTFGLIKMNHVTTSTTLLKNLAGDAAHPRWGEFVARYRPMMEAYMRERFPSIEADDVIQETLIALIDILPGYRYSPEETGAFHNYLTGVLRHKALNALACGRRRSEMKARFSAESVDLRETATDAEDRDWRDSVFKIALGIFLSDDAVQERTKQIFRRVAINGEKPDAVATDFGVTRNAVDQIKSRSTARLKEIVNALEAVGDAPLRHG